MKIKKILFVSSIIIFGFLGCFKEDENELINKTYKLYENKKYDEALKYSKKLCELGHPYFCYLTAFIVKGTGGNSIEENKYYEKGCEVKIKKIDGNMSKDIFEKDLENKNKCCVEYAINLHQQGNVLKSNAILEDICNNKEYIPACTALASIALNNNNNRMAIKYIAKAIKIYNSLDDSTKKKYASDVLQLNLAGVKLCAFVTLMNAFGSHVDKNLTNDCNVIDGK